MVIIMLMSAVVVCNSFRSSSSSGCDGRSRRSCSLKDSKSACHAPCSATRSSIYLFMLIYDDADDSDDSNDFNGHVIILVGRFRIPKARGSSPIEPVRIEMFRVNRKQSEIND